jgi:hypothetical protein
MQIFKSCDIYLGQVPTWNPAVAYDMRVPAPHCPRGWGGLVYGRKRRERPSQAEGGSPDKGCPHQRDEDHLVPPPDSWPKSAAGCRRSVVLAGELPACLRPTSGQSIELGSARVGRGVASRVPHASPMRRNRRLTPHFSDASAS